MPEKTTWERKKDWAKRNSTVAGAVTGLLAGGVIRFLVGQEQDRRETKTAQIDKPKDQQVDKAGPD